MTAENDLNSLLTSKGKEQQQIAKEERCYKCITHPINNNYSQGMKERIEVIPVFQAKFFLQSNTRHLHAGRFDIHEPGDLPGGKVHSDIYTVPDIILCESRINR